MAPTFRADQVGSLLRPSALLEARKPQDIYLDTALSFEIAEATKAAIADAVKKQLELSIRPITSGEYERTIFYSGFFEKLEGMTTVRDLPLPDAFRTGLPYSHALLRLGRTVHEATVATAPIRHTAPAYLEAWEMLKAVTPREHWGECKMALPSITFEHIQLAHRTAWAPGGLRALYDAGLRHVQIDEPNLTCFFVEAFLDGCRADGVDPDELFDLYDRPADFRIGMHVCRGNLPVFHDLVSGSYERIAEKMFTKLDYDQFYLEYEDQERQGSFAPLRFLPQGKGVVLGIVSTKTGELEDIDILEARVREAAEVIAKGQGRCAEEVLEDTLAVSPQCGFASMSISAGEGVTEEKMWAKLVLLRDLARRLWKNAI
ncbi:Methionine vitamin-b12 [Mycena sanguinolenta]|uniref:Methionine vitamin-b12 n=1 Tax=Mycena sanguinolenta TaxID=230812 RepID=A0A8H6Y335_9AGAR|nr:Methionine vitamin-b12 [Mycena sanguinolenta]